MSIHYLASAFKLCLCFPEIAFREVFGVNGNNVVCHRLDVEPFSKLTVAEDKLQVLVNDVVGKLEVLFHKLLQNLHDSDFVDGGVSVEPLEAHIDFFEGPFPVSGEAELVFVLLAYINLVISLHLEEDPLLTLNVVRQLNRKLLLAEHVLVFIF